MDAKTYRVKSMREALDLIREELGPDASLLHCRRVRQRGVSGWLARKTELEVVASSSEDVPSRFPPEAEKWLARSGSDSAYSQGGNDASKAALDTNISTTISHAASAQARVPLSQARGMESLRSHLVESGVEGRLVADVMDRLSQDGFDFGNASVSEAVGQSAWKIAELLPQGNELNCQAGMSHWVALVGPRGAGKTTTLAKLAAQFARGREMSVAIVKVNPVRDGDAAEVGSEVDQALCTYADLLGIPMIVVGSAAEMITQLNVLTENYDLVLLDTPGWERGSQTVSRRTQEILQVAKPDEIQCVVSTCRESLAELTSHPEFNEFSADGLVLTHLDETPAFHRLWPALQEIALPVNYLTHGCGVPDDLAPASVKQLVLWLQRSMHVPDESSARTAVGSHEQGWAA
jgi:flagellar biosynthesis protein FlhF